MDKRYKSYEEMTIEALIPIITVPAVYLACHYLLRWSIDKDLVICFRPFKITIKDKDDEYYNPVL